MIGYVGVGVGGCMEAAEISTMECPHFVGSHEVTSLLNVFFYLCNHDCDDINQSSHMLLHPSIQSGSG
jgi:hypothetical protein